MNTLLAYRYRKVFRAGNGLRGEKALKHGRKGQDVQLAVPVGTEVWGVGDGSSLLADIVEDGQLIVVARGGGGGRGNARFVSSKNQFPMLAEEGEECECVSVRLELKLLADVGIAGEPNAGKSSLLSAVTAARPKIAEYPFTTLEPVLGVVDHRRESFVLVDIPGLIEGAHKGVGLGHDFLKHMERTRAIIHLIDGGSEDPLGSYYRVTKELRQFGGALGDKPQIVALNKVDLPEALERASELGTHLGREGIQVHPISAVSGDGVGDLLDAVLEVLRAARADTRSVEKAHQPAEIPVLRPRPRRESVEVRKEDGAFIVQSTAAQRLAAMVDVDNWSARIQLYAQLSRMGVVKALENAGVRPGDTVRIGKVEMEWQ